MGSSEDLVMVKSETKTGDRHLNLNLEFTCPLRGHFGTVH